MNGEKPNLKEILDVRKILEVKNGSNLNGCSARIDTGEVIFEFFCETL